MLELNKEKDMTEAIKILKHAESVLMKKIRSMQDGKPKYAASAKLTEIRDAIKILKQVNMDEEIDEQEENEYLTHLFTEHPPQAKA